LHELYTRAGIAIDSSDTKEIDLLKFVLDPIDFITKGNILSSHGLPLPDTTDLTVPYELWESDCIPVSDSLGCISVDALDECMEQNEAIPGDELDNSCFALQILNRNDCSEMADWDQQFCEGVVGVGGNAAQSDGRPAVNPGGPGNAGYGGCRLYESGDDIDANIARAYGRDWYYDGGFQSPDFLVGSDEKARIGSCCGNDPEDVGAIAVNISLFASYPNQYLCYNDSSSSPNMMRWMDAKGSSLLFKILSFNRQGKEFDVVSNSNNWIACNTGDKALSAIYADAEKDGADKWTKGILVDEYEGIPEPKELVAENTEILGGGAGGDGDRSIDPDTGRDSSASEDVIIDEDSFSTESYTVHGAAATTLCDKDGDGYEGNWSADSIAGRFYDSSSPACTSPKPPFDCDEGNLLDDLYPLSYRTPEGRAVFARMRHPGRINYCVDGDDNYHLDCDWSSTFCIEDPTEGEATPGSVLANPQAPLLAPRFICQNVDNKGEFSECCGWDRSFCFNPAKGRREGSALHTLREFDSPIYGDIKNSELLNMTNFVLRYGIGIPGSIIAEGATYRFALFTKNNDLGIKDWRHYKNLEFYIWFTSNYEVDLWFGKFKNISGHSDTEIDQYIFPIKLKITDYVVNEPALRKWLHVVIPIEDIFSVDFTPDVLVFASDAAKVKLLATTVDAPGLPHPFSNVVGIDKIFLTPNKSSLPRGLPADAENFYCSGTWPPSWINDLDQSTPANKYTDQPGGRDACEAIPSYGWTGNKCCGDDTGDNTTHGLIGPATSKEFYADTDAGCWAGNVLANGSRIMLVKYNLSYSGIANREVVHSCRNESCVYELPPIKNVLVTNGNPEVYDLYIVNGGSKFVGRGALTSTNHSYLRVDGVPMQVLYFNSNFWSCNAAKFINETPNDAGTPLIPISNRVTSTGDRCEVKGGFFCDHIDGENSGWSGEGLIRYPGTNITLADGTQKDLGPGSVVAAEFRDATKRDYNLIRNGGFENV
jgi:hypothetical protein